MTAGEIATTVGVPISYLQQILRSLRLGGVLRAKNSAGWTLARPADTVTVGEILRLLEGPIGLVGGVPPEQIDRSRGGDALVEMWINVRSSVVGVIDAVTIADLTTDVRRSGGNELSDGR